MNHKKHLALLKSFARTALFAIALLGCQRRITQDAPPVCPQLSDVGTIGLDIKNYASIAWHPDGNRFVIEWRTPGERGVLLLASVSDRTATPIVIVEPWMDYSNSAASWSPDGERLAFASVHEANRSAILVWDQRLGETHLLHENASFPRWAPNGEALLFVGDGSSFFLSDNDGDNKLVYQGVGIVEEWHPDSRRLLLSFYSSPDDDEGAVRDIAVLDVPTGEVIEVTHNATCELRPKWLADTNTVIYESLLENGNYDILLTDLDSLLTQNLTDTPMKHEVQFTVSPTGEELAYVEYQLLEDDAFIQTMVVMNLETGKRTYPLDPDTIVTALSWSPTGEHIAYWWQECRITDSVRRCNPYVSVLELDSGQSFPVTGLPSQEKGLSIP